jgi:hypothetical protein
MDKKLLLGGVAVLAVIGGAYYLGHKGTAAPPNPQVSALGNTASLLQTNSDATTQLLGGESQVGVTSVAGPYTPRKVSPDILPIIKGSSGVTGSAPNSPFLTPQQYSAYIAAGY